MQTASKKVVNGWAMYDWANSVYNLVITTTFFRRIMRLLLQQKTSLMELNSLGGDL
jgi:MFS transporter, UMF1 family